MASVWCGMQTRLCSMEEQCRVLKHVLDPQHGRPHAPPLLRAEARVLEPLPIHSTTEGRGACELALIPGHHSCENACTDCLELDKLEVPIHYY